MRIFILHTAMPRPTETIDICRCCYFYYYYFLRRVVHYLIVVHCSHFVLCNCGVLFLRCDLNDCSNEKKCSTRVQRTNTFVMKIACSSCHWFGTHTYRRNSYFRWLALCHFVPPVALRGLGPKQGMLHSKIHFTYFHDIAKQYLTISRKFLTVKGYPWPCWEPWCNILHFLFARNASPAEFVP